MLRKKLLSNQAGFSITATMVAGGIMLIILYGAFSGVTNLIKSQTTANLGKNRIQLAQNILNVLSDSDTCSKALLDAASDVVNFGTATSTITDIEQIVLNNEVIAQRSTANDGVLVKQIKLISLGATGKTQLRDEDGNLRIFDKYGAKLVVSLEKEKESGKAYLGPKGFRDEEFILNLVTDPNESNKIYRCYTANIVQTPEGICDLLFGGSFDATNFPQCRLRNLVLENDEGRVDPSTLKLFSTNTNNNKPMLHMSGVDTQAPFDLYIGGHEAGSEGKKYVTLTTHQVPAVESNSNRNSRISIIAGDAEEHAPRVHLTSKDHGTGGVIQLNYGACDKDIGSTAAVSMKFASPLTCPDNPKHSSGVAEQAQMLYVFSKGVKLNPFKDQLIANPSVQVGASTAFEANYMTVNGTMAVTEKLTVVGDVESRNNLQAKVLTINNINAQTISASSTISSASSMSATAFNTSSDQALKTEIKKLENSLDKLMQVRGVEFYWKFTSKQRQIGVIAQEVEREFPELVTRNKNGNLQVNYGGLVAPLIEAIKELYQSHLSQDKKIKMLEERLSLLEKKLQQK